MNALDFEDVHAAYGPYKALNGLTLTVGASENVALLGRNGVGKSTLVRVASGIVPVTSGSLEVLGRTRSPAPPRTSSRATGVVHLPEGVGLFAGLYHRGEPGAARRRGDAGPAPLAARQRPRGARPRTCVAGGG